MIVVNIFNFVNHICKLTFRDINDAAFHLVNYECVGTFDSYSLWIHKTKAGFYALLSFSD